MLHNSSGTLFDGRETVEEHLVCFLPWEGEPYRLWSLLDMLRLYGAAFANAMAALGDARSTIAWVEYEPQHRTEARLELRTAFKDIELALAELPLPRSLRAQSGRLIQRLEEDNEDWHVILAVVREFQENLLQELSGHLFLAVPLGRTSMYLDPPEWFGQIIIDQFPDTDRDIRDACQCFALAQWTASVFHSMRILERGLRSLANALRLSNMDMENWQHIIDQLEKRIREMGNEPRSAGKSERLRFYSEAATQFRYFKDAWRNGVIHSRTSYDEQGAQSILEHVRDFMTHLAKEQPASQSGPGSNAPLP